MTMSFTAAEATALMAPPGANRVRADSDSQAGTYDEQFTLVDAKGTPLADTYYTVRHPSGTLTHGTTDSLGRTQRYETDGAQRIAVYVGHRENA
jgi:uncharacterized protein (DUF2345 family)